MHRRAFITLAFMRPGQGKETDFAVPYNAWVAARERAGASRVDLTEVRLWDRVEKAWPRFRRAVRASYGLP